MRISDWSSDVCSSDLGSIVILTGAGISAESGLGTFRDKDGLWTKYDLNDVATPEDFSRNPVLVHDFYNARRKNLTAALPNEAPVALAELEQGWAGDFLLVTQNVEDRRDGRSVGKGWCSTCRVWGCKE